MDKQDWRLLLLLLLSHHRPEKLDRTIHVRFKGESIHICARCIGTYSAVLMMIVFVWFLGFDFPVELYIPLIAILPTPTTLDWITQSCKVRESRNIIRISTGFLLGLSQGLFLLIIIKGMFTLFLQVIIIIGIYFLSIYIIAWKTKCLDSYFD